MAFRDLWKKLTARTPEPAAPPPARPGDTNLEQMFVERFAAHFPGAVTDGSVVTLPFGGLTVRCELAGLDTLANQHSAALYFWISGGPFDNGPVFASVSGYGESPLEAVVMGCCNWACAFGPVLRAGLGGETVTDIGSFEGLVDGQAVRLSLQHLDRVIRTAEATETPPAIIEASRARLGPDGWLLRRVVESGSLPLLRSDRPVLLSAFLMDSDDPLREVKVNGGDWPPSFPSLGGLGPRPVGAFPFMRELGVLVPLAPPPALTRAGIERTLRPLMASEGEAPSRSATSWRGFRAHGGRLADPLPVDAIATILPGAFHLPDDYAAFLRDIASSGAAPGYGLLSPAHPGQQALLARSEPPGPSLALAHAGCGVTWLLGVGSEHHGQVWVDAMGSDESVKQVDASFSGWYRRWLDSVVRDVAAWIQWDSQACATAGVFVQVFEKLERDGVPEEARAERLRSLLKAGAITLKSGGSNFFVAGDRIDPCAGCVALAARFGIGDGVFGVGLPPLQAR